MKELVVACDIGGTNMRVALLRHEEVLRFVSVRTPKSKKKFLSLLVDLVQRFDSSSVRKIGVGIAGQVKDGVVLDTPNIGIKRFDLKKFLEKRFGKSVFVANDADCFALAELCLGSKKDNMVLVTLGTGIGGGLVFDGRPYRGGSSSGMGVELGHMIVQGKDWEVLWHESKRRAVKVFGPGTTFSDLCSLNKHHKHAKKILFDTADHLGQGFASLINLLDPEIVVLGGGVRDAGSHFLSLVKKATLKYSFGKKIPPIKWTSLEHAGILGASLLVK